MRRVARRTMSVSTEWTNQPLFDEGEIGGFLHRERIGSRRETVPHDVTPPIWNVFRGDAAAAVIHNCAASPEGFFCVLDLLGQNCDLSLGFNLGGPEDSDEPKVWLEIQDVPGGAVVTHLSQLEAGEGGQSEDGLDRWTLRLWFPLEVASIQGLVTFHIHWSRLEPVHGRIDLPPKALETAAKGALQFR